MQKSDVKGLAKAGAGVVVGLVMFNVLSNIGQKVPALGRILSGNITG